MVHLIGVVGEQPHGLYAQLAQNLGANIVFAQVAGESEGEVGLEGVHAVVLQLVGAQLVHQPDAPPFLAHVQYHPAPLGFYLGHSRGQLLAAIAAQAAEGVAGQTFGMYAHQHVGAITDVPFHQGHMVFAIQLVHEGVRAKRSVARGHGRVGYFHHMAFVLLAVVLQRLDGDELQIESPGKLDQLGRAHHGTVLAHNLAAQTAFLKAGEAHQIDGGLGVAVAFQYAIGFRHQRKHVARAAEVAGLGVGPHHGPRG